MFVSTLGGIAYAEVDIDDGAWAYASLVPKQERRRKMDLNDLRLMPCESSFNRSPHYPFSIRLGTGDRRKLDCSQQQADTPVLAQDLLERVVEGPEGDTVYEVFAEQETQPSPEPEEEEYDEEERVMDAWPGMDED